MLSIDTCPWPLARRLTWWIYQRRWTSTSTQSTGAGTSLARRPSVMWCTTPAARSPSRTSPTSCYCAGALSISLWTWSLRAFSSLVSPCWVGHMLCTQYHLKKAFTKLIANIAVACEIFRYFSSFTTEVLTLKQHTLSAYPLLVLFNVSARFDVSCFILSGARFKNQYKAFRK